ADSVTGQANPGATTDPSTFRSDNGRVSPLSVLSFGGDWTPTSKLVVTSRYGYFFSNNEDRGKPQGTRYIYDTTVNASSQDLTKTLFPASTPFNISGFSTIPNNFGTHFDAFKRKSFSGDASYYVGHALGSPNGNFCGGRYGFVFTGSQTVSNTGKTSQTAHALFLQDNWTVGHGLTLNLGIRFDKETLPPYDPVRFPTVKFGWGDKIAPRIGGAYDLLHNGKVKVYASYGKFFDIMKMNLARGSFGSDYWHDCVYALDTTDYTTITPTLNSFAGCPASGPAPGVTVGRFIENVDFRATKADPRDPAIDVNMNPMSQHEFVAGVEWAIR